MSFGVPVFLGLLAAIPLLGLAFALFLRWWRRALTEFAGPQRPPVSWVVMARRLLRLTLLALALTLLALALARPQVGSEPTQLRRQGVDLVIALDVSQSMLAEDVQPNRLEAAKEGLIRLLNRLQGHRVGLVLFAGEAMLRFPLTTDIGVAQELVREVSVTDVSVPPGTALGDAVRVATTAFTRGETASKVVLLITDGEDQGSQPLASVAAAVEEGITVYTVGIGRPQGSVIPIRDLADGQVRLKVDPETGQPAVTRLDEALLRQMAAVGQGRYFSAGDGSLDGVANVIGRLARTTFAVTTGSRPIERFGPFALAALALLVVELALPEGRLSLRRVRWL
ncbi:MAG: VWA domain-containing protein [Dehalococcoidia bacterium]